MYQISWEDDTQDSKHFLGTVHPFFDNIDNYVYSEKSGVRLVDAEDNFTIPLRIFFTMSTGTTESSIHINSLITSTRTLTKRLRIFLEPENENRPFEAEVVFKLKRNRTTASAQNEDEQETTL